MAAKTIKYRIILISIFFQIFLCLCRAEDFEPFQGKVNKDNINIRSDSTVSSEVICQVNQGEYLEVILELYDWYKVKLPKSAPTFIKRDFVALLDTETSEAPQRRGCVLKDNVNVRLYPDESSLIIGKVDKEKIVKIQEEKGEWYKIEPPDASFGWIHKNFVNRLVAGEIKIGEETEAKAGIKTETTTLDLATEKLSNEENISLTGILKSYGRLPRRLPDGEAGLPDGEAGAIARHKLLTKDKKIFLLQGDCKELDIFLQKKVKVIGRPINSTIKKYPLLEILKIELAE